MDWSSFIVAGTGSISAKFTVKGIAYNALC